MPTLKPRISITFDQADIDVLDRFAAVSGTPRASVVSGLIQSAIPELERAAELMELAAAAPDSVRQGMVEQMANAAAEAMGFLQPFHRDYKQVMDRLSRGLDEGRDPHLLTGGSK